MVRHGGLLASQDRFWRDAVDEVFNPVVQMARTFAPESTIVRRLLDSDHWPITWEDDDA